MTRNKVYVGLFTYRELGAIYRKYRDINAHTHTHTHIYIYIRKPHDAPRPRKLNPKIAKEHYIYIYVLTPDALKPRNMNRETPREDFVQQ